MVELGGFRSAKSQRQVLRTAIRQLERADLYLGAVSAMELDDAEGARAVRRLRSDLESLRRYLVDVRSET
jgi:hypothetical protein